MAKFTKFSPLGTRPALARRKQSSRENFTNLAKALVRQITMSVKINHDLCIGCGTCEALCPAVFKLNAEGKADVINEKEAACAKNAAESCPTQAIEVN